MPYVHGLYCHLYCRACTVRLRWCGALLQGLQGQATCMNMLHIRGAAPPSSTIKVQQKAKRPWDGLAKKIKDQHATLSRACVERIALTPKSRTLFRDISLAPSLAPGSPTFCFKHNNQTLGVLFWGHDCFTVKESSKAAATVFVAGSYQLGSIMTLARTQFEISDGKLENGKNHYQQIYNFYLLAKGFWMTPMHNYNHV